MNVIPPRTDVPGILTIKKGGDDTPLVRTTVSSKGGGAESQDTVEQGTEVYRNRYYNLLQ